MLARPPTSKWYNHLRIPAGPKTPMFEGRAPAARRAATRREGEFRLTQRSDRNTYLRGAFILAGAAMVSRLLGALYRMPLGRVMGDYAIGLYGAGYNFYNALWGISTVGINVAISKVMAERIARDDETGAYRVFRISFVLLAVAGGAAALVLALAARPLASGVARNPEAYYAIFALSPALLLVAIEGALRGYFQGYQQMTPSAISQIVEQFFRVGAIIGLAYLLLPRGPAITAGGAALGATAGAALGILYLLLPLSRSRREVRRRVAQASRPDAAAEAAGAIVRRVVALAVPISLAGVVIPIMGLIDLAVVPLRLQATGFSVTDSTRLFGQLTQFAMPLINLPAVITYGLQTSLVPAVSEAQSLGDAAGIRGKTSSAIRASLLIALPAFAGLWLLATPISSLLYASPESGIPLAALSGAVIFLMLQQTTSGVLQGLGRTAIPVRNLLVGAAVKFVLEWSLTGIPALNIQGAALSTVAGFMVASALNLHAVNRLIGLHVDWSASVLKPAMSATIMGLVLYFAYPPLAAAFGMNLAALLAVVIGGLVYGFALLALGGVRERDLAVMPVVGPKVARVLKGVGLVRE